jgi:hypothetical protein
MFIAAWAFAVLRVSRNRDSLEISGLKDIQDTSDFTKLNIILRREW